MYFGLKKNPILQRVWCRARIDFVNSLDNLTGPTVALVAEVTVLVHIPKKHAAC